MWFAYHRQWRVQPTETYKKTTLSYRARDRLSTVLTSDGEPWASGEELQILPPCWRVENRHGLNQITDGSALGVESMVCLDRLIQCYVARYKYLSVSEPKKNKGTHFRSTSLPRHYRRA